MYFDEIDLLENLPFKEDIKVYKINDDWFSIELYSGEVKNLFMVLEELTRKEFEQIAYYLISKLKSKEGDLNET